MSRRAAGAIAVLLGLVVLRLVIFGEILNYVRPVMRPYLLITGALLVALGVAEIVVSIREAGKRVGPTARHAAPVPPDDGHGRDDGHGHDEEGAHPAAWLLCIPAFLALVIPPPALGSYVAGRSPTTVPPPAVHSVFQPLPDGTAALSLIDYAQRAVWDDGRTLADHPVTLTGFVTPRLDGAWYLTRMHLICCAADAQTTMIEIDTSALAPPPTPTRDSWVTVTGTWLASTDPDPAHAVARLAAMSVQEVGQPTNPYE